MTQEEKAKAYDEALKVLHKYDGANIMFSQSLKEEMFPELKYRVQPKQEWSEKYIADVFEKVGLAKIAREQGYDSLTEAIQSAMIELSKFTPQPKQEWSEEDKETIDYLIDYLESELDSSYTKEDKEEFTKEIELLKSLRPQNTWRPTEKQIEYLAKAIATLGDEGNCKTASILNDLRVELKKLRED